MPGLLWRFAHRYAVDVGDVVERRRNGWPGWPGNVQPGQPGQGKWAVRLTRDPAECVRNVENIQEFIDTPGCFLHRWIPGSPAPWNELGLVVQDELPNEQISGLARQSGFGIKADPVFRILMQEFDDLRILPQALIHLDDLFGAKTGLSTQVDCL